jgi:hypothetical protein
MDVIDEESVEQAPLEQPAEVLAPLEQPAEILAIQQGDLPEPLFNPIPAIEAERFIEVYYCIGDSASGIYVNLVDLKYQHVIPNVRNGG